MSEGVDLICVFFWDAIWLKMISHLLQACRLRKTENYLTDLCLLILGATCWSKKEILQFVLEMMPRDYVCCDRYFSAAEMAVAACHFLMRGCLIKMLEDTLCCIAGGWVKNRGEVACGAIRLLS